METEKDIKANILIEIKDAVMHRFVKKEKTLYTEGTCKIAKIQNAGESPVYFLNINSFYYTLTKSILFVKLEFEDSVSYIFSHFDNGMSSITFSKNDEVVHNFDEIISNAAELKQFNAAYCDHDFEVKINQHCPHIDKQAIVSADRIKSGITYAGKGLESGFKLIGDYLTIGVSKIGGFIQSKIEQPQVKTEVNPNTKQKWQTLKNGTNNVLNISKELYIKYLAPFVSKGLDYGKQLTQKIDNSENKTVKYVKGLACTSGNAMCIAFKGLSDGTYKVVNELGCQSRKIVNKRFGQDYVKTFLPSQETENKQNVETSAETPTAQLKERQSNEESKRLLYPNLEQKRE